jgi:hypothetical protein
MPTWLPDVADAQLARVRPLGLSHEPPLKSLTERELTVLRLMRERSRSAKYSRSCTIHRTRHRRQAIEQGQRRASADLPMIDMDSGGSTSTRVNAATRELWPHGRRP